MTLYDVIINLTTSKQQIMKENSSDHKCAFEWNNLNNDQRHKLVKKLEDDYGADFGHQAKWNNEYCTPPVKAGALLSKKHDLMNLGFYPDNMMSTIVSIRSARDLVVHAPKVVEKTLAADTKMCWVGVFGDDKIGTLFYSKSKAKKIADEDNELFSNVHDTLGEDLFGVPAEIVMPAGSTIYELQMYDYDKEAYVVHPQWNAFKDKKSAIERAAHEMRFLAAFFIQWDTWKDAGLKAPESYDFLKENVFTFTKAQLLKSMASKRLSSCWTLCKTSYWKKLTNPKVDTKFIEWCKENL